MAKNDICKFVDFIMVIHSVFLLEIGIMFTKNGYPYMGSAFLPSFHA